jgi:hypothetical protein
VVLAPVPQAQALQLPSHLAARIAAAQGSGAGVQGWRQPLALRACPLEDSCRSEAP